jgi:hypothetical protein
MVSDARNDNVALQTLANADKSVRAAISQYGSQSEEVVAALSEYGALLRDFGYEEQAQRIAERVRKMREVLGANTKSPKEAGAPRPEVNLFNSRGEHIAVAWNENLYLPNGKHIGRWAADLAVYLDRKGNYLGIVVEENRLVADKNWQFRNMNFGDRGNEGDRPGWTKKRDIDAVAMPKWLEDVSL